MNLDRRRKDDLPQPKMQMSSPGRFRRVPAMTSRFSSSAFGRRLLLAAFASLAGALAGGAAFAQYSPVGLSSVRSQRFENEDLLFFVPEEGDLFAWAVAAGDFNGDGADDLATGIPNDDGFAGSGCTDCGIVVVRYGIPGVGLETFATSTVLFQGFAGSPSDEGPSELFGRALAVGDFNGDSYDDLAVGVPGDRHPTSGTVIGAVQVHYGSEGGLLVQNAEWIYRYLAGWEFPPTTCPVGADEFGAALAAGNFDGDAFDDLAIGAPAACAGHVGEPQDSGAVYVAHGGSAGLLPISGYFLSENSPGIFGDAANGERFGEALAAGDFDGGGGGSRYDDLAIGVPGEGANGSVYIVMGSEFGLIYANSVFWAPGALGIVPEPGARLGAALAAGDFDGDGHDDLVIGDPEQDIGPADDISDAGVIVFAFGAPGGFDLSRNLRYGEPAGADVADRFGWSLAVGDFNRDGRDDVAVGAPFEDSDGSDRGSVSVFMGAAGSAVGLLSQELLAGVEGIPGDLQNHQDFGRALASGDFDGDGHADLAIGAPYSNLFGIALDVGMEVVLYGSLFADGFETGYIQNWSEVAP
jgi:hypothetical protein